jgi:hypothetical protein
MSKVLSYDEISDMALDGMSMRQAYLLACDIGRGNEFLQQWHYGGPRTRPFTEYLRRFHVAVDRLETDERFAHAAAALYRDIADGAGDFPEPIDWGADSVEWDEVLRRYYTAQGGESDVNPEALLVLFQIQRDYDRIMEIRAKSVVSVS